uniref:DNA 3'-5' helicase n=1 Tax=Candidatus Kentrum sp. SD TaxID=2126332 RepID=A0A451BQU8_9GAMM|nr:MAG: ATP-dependent exoDNAse (exonuclease V) beta subunit (contains helicase and exonuclease domains) [Candidatus Kentron sp. SD]
MKERLLFHRNRTRRYPPKGPISLMLPHDQPIRDRALDASRSFIVQAPAGSGKTGLLIQRYLTLLGEVEDPEEVIAVTFTRKAAGEMRERVLVALDRARGEAPGSPFQRRVRELADRVVARDKARGWEIRSYPARLRIQTIDSLCAWIIQQAPWRSRLGGELRVVEDAGPLYREAAHGLVMDLDNRRGPDGDALARVLLSLDNDIPRFEATLIRMLARRDQWLRHPLGEADSESRRGRMSRALGRVVRDALESLRASVPLGMAREIPTLGDYAGGNLARTDPSSPIAALAGLDAVPGEDVEAMTPWRGIAELFLTRAGAWRSRYTKKEGFPPGKDADAARMKERIRELDRSKAEVFRARLHAVRELPIPVYEDRQWAVLDALMTVLGMAAAALRKVFMAHGVADFIEVSQGALAALGEEGAQGPAPGFDCGIRHLLVDEFQDTSHAQILLFNRITANWRVGDGRTLFLVGDPMQSIYGFREADVGLYLRAWQHGLGQVPLEPLTLSGNFRSQGRLVAWCNRVFPSAFPDADDMGAGAVSFKPSVPHRAATPSPGVSIHAYRKNQADREAEGVLAAIRAARKEDPAGSIAILARTRTHLEAILPRLRAAGIGYRGVGIASLAHRQIIQDLLALTRALLHPGDRVAWLSVLRAPWCGLTLHDLHGLAGEDHKICILDRLRDECARPSPAASPNPGSPPRERRLGPDGRRRAERVFRILDDAFRQRSRTPLRIAVEHVRMALGGPACMEADGIADVRAFFDLLEQLEAETGGPPDGQRIADRVSRLYATPDAAEGQVEIMTIHKAKGLEFDTVILPGLDRKVRVEERPLLAWVERPTAAGGFDLLLAPMTGPGDPEDPIYHYLRILDETRADHETARLLYVAITRARERLYLIGGLQPPEGNEKAPPRRGSLLARLWPALQSEFQASLADGGSGADSEMEPDTAPEMDPEHPPSPPDFASAPPRQPIPLQRLPADWMPPETLPEATASWYPSVHFPREATVPMPDPPEISEMQNTARSVGILIHRILRNLAEDATRQWRTGRAQEKSDVWRSVLRGFGVPADQLEPALERVVRAFDLVIRDPRWHWITDPRHTLARNEYPLTGIVRDRMVNGVIDRTFVDAQGIRWIIDYKTDARGARETTEFPDWAQSRYRDQLTRYADLFKGMESRPIRAGVYFPLWGGWLAWEIGA